MNMQTRNKLFAYLAGAALSVSAGGDIVTNVQGGLAAVPETLLDEILDEAEGTAWKDEDRLVLLSVLAEDKRPHVRMRVSELLEPPDHGFSFASLEPILFRLASDEAAAVRGAVAGTLAAELSRSDTLTRTRVVSEWTLSNSTAVRDTIARVLSHDFYCLGAAAAAEHLASDHSPSVRAAAADAAASRHWQNPAHYQQILERLSADRNRKVRRAARRAEIALS